MVSLSNSLSFISSPLDQFEIRTLLSLDAPILANMEITVTNIVFYLIVGVSIAFILNGLATNYYQIVSNN
jgi:F-type H+-transporting ATPase subunit a